MAAAASRIESSLYSLPTPNGVKVSIMLEETGLPYEPHVVSFDTNDQKTPEFLSLNPNGKIPAILDPERTGRQAPGPVRIRRDSDLSGRQERAVHAARCRHAVIETIQWLMFQMSAIGPMFGQIGFFHKFAGKDYEDKRPLQRYVDESQRLLGVLDQRLGQGAWIMGDDYSIADISTFPWVGNLIGFYDAGDLVGIAELPARHARACTLSRSARRSCAATPIPKRP